MAGLSNPETGGRSWAKARFGGLGVAAKAVAAPARTPLALFGGPKSITFRWRNRARCRDGPLRHGGKEGAPRHDRQRQILRGMPKFEKEWQDYTKSPFVKRT